jgi:3-oxoacyl-[acyl-carrier-protein] synthase-3
MAFHLMGTGSTLLSRAVTNDELSKFLDTSDERIRTRTGIEERRVCTTETLDELAVGASKEALRRSGVAAEDIDLNNCSATSGDHIMPAEARAVTEALGLAVHLLTYPLRVQALFLALMWPMVGLLLGRRSTLLLYLRRNTVSFLIGKTDLLAF